MAATVQDEGNDTGNSPAVIARELGAKVEALELGKLLYNIGCSLELEASGGQASASGYPDVKGALASSKKDGGEEPSGYPGIAKALPQGTSAKSSSGYPELKSSLEEGSKKKNV